MKEIKKRENDAKSGEFQGVDNQKKNKLIGRGIIKNDLTVNQKSVHCMSVHCLYRRISGEVLYDLYRGGD